MSFTENTWDANQKAGYISLQDFNWGGSYEVQKYENKYWLSYLGGATSGYEAGTFVITSYRIHYTKLYEFATATRCKNQIAQCLSIQLSCRSLIILRLIRW